MCGIVGMASRAPARDLELLSRMRDTMGHRGPDDAGVWWSADDRVGLGHRRLAVIDLTPTGHQPMEDLAARVCITFNGEIYNHRELRRELESEAGPFRGSSDTEVILHAYLRWGDDCLARLRGMFAFALWDGRNRRLLLARDRCGEKPLYYWLDERGGIQFASELKALMANPAVPRVLDLESLEHYLAYAFVPSSRCMLRGLRKLPPAHALSWSLDTGTATHWCYWHPEIVSPPATGSIDGLTDELQRLLAAAVRDQLVADVPVGVLLSGGLDSSLITAAAAVQTSRVRTFTVAFPGHGRYDESGHAAFVAAHFGTDHHVLEAGEIRPDLLPLLARQFDEPMGDSSMLPTFLLSTLVRQHATVALGGDGGDELFGGYRYYSWLPLVEQWRARAPAPLRQALATVGRALPVGTPGRNHLVGFDDGADRALAQVDLYFDAATRAALLGPLGRRRLLAGESPESAKAAAGPPQLSALRRAMVGDFRRYLPDDVLVKVDRASMLASLEVRAPFLDPPVVAFALGAVPDAALARHSRRKILLQRLAARLLPRGFDVTRKQGFSVPLAHWLSRSGAWWTYLSGVLAESDVRLFDRTVVDRLLRGQRRGLNNAKRLFALALFELWRREYDVRVPG
ncbi:MAG TPA: asparagine synthase (glutamine-hydrolyzing) [Gemmatimonadales bacterium]|nr:asparagine synthase (glutamine-hydrolyzing) [Gemmatimonadales bacterium]